MSHGTKEGNDFMAGKEVHYPRIQGKEGRAANDVNDSRSPGMNERQVRQGI